MKKLLFSLLITIIFTNIYIENIVYIAIYKVFRERMVCKFIMNKIDKYLSNEIKSFILIFAASLMIGHGARMIYQGLFLKETSYTPVLFDILLDWLTLLVLGIIMLLFGLSIFYKNMYKKHEKEKNKKDMIFVNPS